MKRFYLGLLLLFCFTPHLSQAQYASVFGQDTTRWTETFCQLDVFSENTYAMFKDTVINGLDYKISCSYNGGVIGVCGWLYPSIITGFMREDTTQGKVWYYAIGMNSMFNTDTTEQLIADFSLQVGDTFTVWNPSNTTHEDKLVDSIWTANGRRHVRVDFAPYFNLEKLTFIEGVGSNFSPFYQFNSDYNLCPCLAEWKKDASVAFSQNCQVMGSSEEPSAFRTAEIIPHPVHRQSQLIFENPGQASATLRLYDLTGKEVLRKQNRSSFFMLNSTALPEGILFYRLSLDNEDLYRGKLWVAPE